MKLVELPSQPPSARGFIALCGALGAGALAGWGLLAGVTSSLNGELSRTAFLAQTFKNLPAVPPRAVAIGNSVTMNGLDCGALGAALTPSRETWNLATTGQTLLESALLLDALPESVNEILYCTTIDGLVGPVVTTEPSKLIAARLYGLSPGETVPLVWPEGRPLPPELNFPYWRIVLESRWILRASLDNSFRTVLRPDLNLKRANDDLHFPQLYTQRIAPSTYQRALRRQADGRASSEYKINGHSVDIITALRDWARRHNRRFVVVILPENPDLRGVTPPSLYTAAEQMEAMLREKGVEIVDLSTQLAAEDFVDIVHPGPEGAKKLTDALVRALREMDGAAPSR